MHACLSDCLHAADILFSVVVLILVESRETIAVTTMMMTTLFSFVVAVEYAPAVERERVPLPLIVWLLVW